MKIKYPILWIPVWFALAFIVLNYFFVGLLQQALTPQAEQMYQEMQGQLFLASFLFLFPNLLLSFLLWAYMKNHAPANRDLYILCLTSIAIGFVPQLFIYGAYYSLWYETGAHLPVVMFGFPFVYLFGMMMGWVIGLWLVSFTNTPGEKR